MLAWLGDWAEAYWFWVSAAFLLGFGLLEVLRPGRRAQSSVAVRWVTHFSLYAVDLTASALVIPYVLAFLLIGEPAAAGFRPFGLLHRAGGDWAVLAAGLLALDFLFYWLHRVQHDIHPLWRFHAVHHADIDMDVSTALRHHPLAYLLTAASGTIILLELGLPSWVFAVYGLFELTCGSFQHIGCQLPAGVESALRPLLMTPGLHHVHHSVDDAHYNHNFGNVLTAWDRLFGTYLALPPDRLDTLRFGVAPYTHARYARVHWAWIMPFVMRSPRSAAAAAAAHEQQRR